MSFTLCPVSSQVQNTTKNSAFFIFHLFFRSSFCGDAHSFAKLQFIRAKWPISHSICFIGNDCYRALFAISGIWTLHFILFCLRPLLRPLLKFQMENAAFSKKKYVFIWFDCECSAGFVVYFHSRRVDSADSAVDTPSLNCNSCKIISCFFSFQFNKHVSSRKVRVFNAFCSRNCNFFALQRDKPEKTHTHNKTNARKKDTK